jgi:hypothetical protein
MRVVWVACLLGALLLSQAGAASAEPRIALIIANGSYKGDIGPLKNPVSNGKLAWGRPPTDLRSAKRGGLPPDLRSKFNSIRLVREL